MDIVYTILRELAEPPSLDDCAPLEYPGDVAALEHWRVVPTESGPYLLEGVIADRAITSVVFAVYGRALARIAERWVVLGRPLDGHLARVRRVRRDPESRALDRQRWTRRSRQSDARMPPSFEARAPRARLRMRSELV